VFLGPKQVGDDDLGAPLKNLWPAIELVKEGKPAVVDITRLLSEPYSMLHRHGTHRVSYDAAHAQRPLPASHRLPLPTAVGVNIQGRTAATKCASYAGLASPHLLASLR
jgi:hypothetical protein